VLRGQFEGKSKGKKGRAPTWWGKGFLVDGEPSGNTRSRRQRRDREGVERRRLYLSGHVIKKDPRSYTTTKRRFDLRGNRWLDARRRRGKGKAIKAFRTSTAADRRRSYLCTAATGTRCAVRHEGNSRTAQGVGKKAGLEKGSLLQIGSKRKKGVLPDQGKI